MNLLTLILIGLSMVLVTAVLAVGVYGMMKGGAFNEKYGNRLMRARVALQGVALALLALAYFASRS